MGLHKITFKIPYFPSWNTANQAVVRYVFGHHSSGCIDDIITDGNAREDGDISAIPDIIADGNRFSDSQMLPASFGRKRMI